jgi:hypothetical protein
MNTPRTDKAAENAPHIEAACECYRNSSRQLETELGAMTAERDEAINALEAWRFNEAAWGTSPEEIRKLIAGLTKERDSHLEAFNSEIGLRMQVIIERDELSRKLHWSEGLYRESERNRKAVIEDLNTAVNLLVSKSQDIAAEREKVAKLRDAFGAACAFIDSNTGDPDITAEMCSTYALFVEQRKTLEGIE